LVEIMGTIRFEPWGREIGTDGQSSLLRLARHHGLPIRAVCGGKKRCGTCRVIVEKCEGRLPSPSPLEREVLGDLLKQNYRLACETVISGDAVVRVPRESRDEEQVILSTGARLVRPRKPRPPVRGYAVKVPAPRLTDLAADRERLLSALREVHGLKRTRLDPLVLKKIPAVLRSQEGHVAVYVRGLREVVDLRPGSAPGPCLGMAFDVGTTTVVGYLLDLASGMQLSVQTASNPQAPFGADVISRISHCRESDGRLAELQELVLNCLNELVAAACAEAQVSPEYILEAVCVGNTAMHHLLLGLDPTHLALAPYPPVLQGALDIKARDLGLRISETGTVHLLPLKAGFVGSDAMACILATGIHQRAPLTLLMDLGTNGELVLGNREGLICCSTAAGPAFEGGHIRCGVRARPGAIDRVQIEPGTLEVSFSTIRGKAPVGLCGSGVISAVAELVRAGVLGGMGGFNQDLDTAGFRKGTEGWEFVLVPSSETPQPHDIILTQKDISEVQMAKAAIRAGAILLQEARGGVPIEQILLAGAGGSYMDPADAREIGLFPPGSPVDAVGVGNAAGYGACLALLDERKRREALKVARSTGYLELAAEPRFQELFVSSMFLGRDGGMDL